jgi:hypothetical protein
MGTFRPQRHNTNEVATDAATDPGGKSSMRHVIICQESALLTQAYPKPPEHGEVLYLVDDRTFQRKLSKAGHQALSGDLRDGRIYQRAHVNRDDKVLIQVRNPELTEEIVQQLQYVESKPSVAVLTRNGCLPILPETVKHVSAEVLVAQATETALSRSETHRRVQALREVLAPAKNLLILVQHDPDPDAIASALALRTVLGRNKTTAPLGSFGQVTRPENVTMIRLLEARQYHRPYRREHAGAAGGGPRAPDPTGGDRCGEVPSVPDRPPDQGHPARPVHHDPAGAERALRQRCRAGDGLRRGG